MFYPKAHGVFYLSQMKLPEQHKVEQLFQQGYVLVIGFVLLYSHSIMIFLKFALKAALCNTLHRYFLTFL
jgi:hypothetical protein